MNRRELIKKGCALIVAPMVIPFSGLQRAPSSEETPQVQNPAMIIQDMFKSVGMDNMLDKESFDESHAYFEENDMRVRVKKYETLGAGIDDITFQTRSFLYLQDGKVKMAATEKQLPDDIYAKEVLTC